MAIGFRSAGAVTSGVVDPTAAPGAPTPRFRDDMMILLVLTRAATPPTATAPSGWTAPAGNTVTGGTGAEAADVGLVRVTMFYRVATADNEAMPASVDLSAAPNPSQVKVLVYSKAPQELWAAPVCATSSDTTGSTTSYDPPAAGTVISLAAGDWLGFADAINGDAGTATVPGTVTATGVTFGTVVSRSNDATTSGNDSRLMTGDVPYTSGTASAGPDHAVTFSAAGASMCGCTVFYRLQVTSPTQLPAALVAAPWKSTR